MKRPLLALLIPVSAFASGLEMKDGVLTDAHVDLTLTDAQKAMLTPGDPPNHPDRFGGVQLILTSEQRAAIEAAGGPGITWVYAKPPQLWNDCVCGMHNLGVIRDDTLSVDLGRADEWSPSDAVLTAFRARYLHPATEERAWGQGTEGPRDIAAAELLAAVPAYTDRVGHVVTDPILGTYRTFSVALPKGAAVGRMEHTGAVFQLSDLETFAGLPWHRADLRLTERHRARSLTWPDSATWGDHVALASICPDGGENEHPCYEVLTYDADGRVTSAVWLDPEDKEPVLTVIGWQGDEPKEVAEWRGDDAWSVTAVGPSKPR